MKSLSVVIPVHNEAENVQTLAFEIEDAFRDASYEWEVVWVNDCSSDNTRMILERIGADSPRHSVINLTRASGQSAAVLTGIHRSKYELIGTLDGDGQNSPRDLVDLKNLLEEHELWLAQGVRVKRMDSGMRKISTKIANAVRNSALGIELNDVGCAVRVFQKKSLVGIPAFKGWHRFLPVMIALTAPEKIRELPVSHRARLAGQSKYGIMNRLWVGIYDIFGVMWLKNRGVALPLLIAHE